MGHSVNILDHCGLLWVQWLIARFSIALKLKCKKAVRSTDILTKLIKEFRGFFLSLYTKTINHCTTEGNFLADFKKSEVCPHHKNDERAVNQTTDQ